MDDACSSISVSMRRSHSVAGVFASRFQKCDEPELSQKSRLPAGSRSRQERTHVDGVVVARQHPLQHRAEFERRDVERDADLLHRVAQHHRAALVGADPALRDHREARLGALLVFDDAVAVAILEADALQQLGALDVVRIARDVGREPGLVARRDRSPDRNRLAEEHRLGERLAIDRVRQRLAELGLLHEGKALVVLLDLRLEAEPERIGIGRDAKLDQLEPCLPLRRGAPPRSPRSAARCA